MPRTGRPKKDDPRLKRVSVRFSNAQMERLAAYCAKHGLNKAQALMKGFEELEKQERGTDQSG